MGTIKYTGREKYFSVQHSEIKHIFTYMQDVWKKYCKNFKKNKFYTCKQFLLTVNKIEILRSGIFDSGKNRDISQKLG